MWQKLYDAVKGSGFSGGLSAVIAASDRTDLVLGGDRFQRAGDVSTDFAWLQERFAVDPTPVDVYRAGDITTYTVDLAVDWTGSMDRQDMGITGYLSGELDAASGAAKWMERRRRDRVEQDRFRGRAAASSIIREHDYIAHERLTLYTMYADILHQYVKDTPLTGMAYTDYLERPAAHTLEDVMADARDAGAVDAEEKSVAGDRYQVYFTDHEPVTDQYIDRVVTDHVLPYVDDVSTDELNQFCKYAFDDFPLRDTADFGTLDRQHVEAMLRDNGYHGR